MAVLQDSVVQIDPVGGCLSESHFPFSLLTCLFKILPFPLLSLHMSKSILGAAFFIIFIIIAWVNFLCVVLGIKIFPGTSL